MNENDTTLGEALQRAYAANRLSANESAAPAWVVRILGITLRLPNFAWRKAAIQRHDLHHVLTGYPFTWAGEVEIAAWEFGAGRYPDAGATAFCTPLALAGLIAMPRRTIAAFRRGRRQRSLYVAPLDDGLLALPLALARKRLSP